MVFLIGVNIGKSLSWPLDTMLLEDLLNSGTNLFFGII